MPLHRRCASWLMVHFEPLQPAFQLLMSPADRKVFPPSFSNVPSCLIAMSSSSADVLLFRRDSCANVRASFEGVSNATAERFTVGVAADPFALAHGGAGTQPCRDGLGALQFVECAAGVPFRLREPLRGCFSASIP